jgi:tetratricopeptide (TPR) repeat protein
MWHNTIMHNTTKYQKQLLITVIAALCQVVTATLSQAVMAIPDSGAAATEYNRIDTLQHLDSLLQSAKTSAGYPFAKQAVVHLVLGKSKGALLYADLALKKDSKLGLAYYIKACAYDELDQRADVIDNLSKSKLQVPNCVDLYFFDMRADAYMGLQNWQAALPDMNEAISLAPNAGWRYKQRGKIYAAMHKYDLALSSFATAIKLQPKDDGCHRARASCYTKMQRYKEALTDFSEAIAICPSAKTYRARAKVYEKLGKKDLAEKDIEMSERSGAKDSETDRP